MSIVPPPDPVTGKFINELSQFLENPPRDLPDGARDQLEQLHSTLKGYGPAKEQMSPGQRAALELGKQGITDGEGQPHSLAARNEDKPSPGQQEYARVTGQSE